MYEPKPRRRLAGAAIAAAAMAVFNHLAQPNLGQEKAPTPAPITTPSVAGPH